MAYNPSKSKRIWRYEHSHQSPRDSKHRRSVIRANTKSSDGHSSITESRIRPSNSGHAKLATADNPASSSFDMLSVEPSPTNAQSSSELTTTQRSSSQTHRSESAIRAEASSSSQAPSVVISSMNIVPTPTPKKEFETSTLLDKLQQLQAEPTLSRTTLVIPATFSLVASSLSTSDPIPVATSGASLGIASASGPVTMNHPTTWMRPMPSITHSPSASASSGPIVQPPMSHSHISPALIAFMAIGGFAALGFSLYVFRRVRYKALHVSRSQFQIASSSGRGGSTGVSGSESNKSFVSGGLGRLGYSSKQKNGHLTVGDESPLWGGREKFSPQIGHGVVDFPPAAHLSDRIPARRRRSLMDTFRRNVPGRLSKYGPGWNPIPEVPTVPTVKITDMDTNHHRGGSGSSFSGSPDPNLASIQVASVTRTLSATASYRGSPLPRPMTVLEHPRPAPRAPPKAVLKAPSKPEVLEQIPPVPKIPDIPGLAAHLTGQKKYTDVNGRSKIAVADISKPRPVMPVNPGLPNSEANRTAGETDPMTMYAKYSVSLGVRNDTPESISRETSMAKKIAQVANSNTKPTITFTVSQPSLPKRDTRALAAAAGVGSPAPSEEYGLPCKEQTSRDSLLPNAPGTPGLGEVGDMMLRPFGQSGSMIPAHLETPAIGLNGRSSYLSTNLGSEADRPAQGTGSQRATAAKAITATSETNVSTLSASLNPDDSDRKTIMSAYSQDFMPLSQQAHMHQNPDYRSPTYSIYNYYGADRVSRMPSMLNGERGETEIGGAM